MPGDRENAIDLDQKPEGTGKIPLIELTTAISSPRERVFDLPPSIEAQQSTLRKPDILILL
jgi:hypothetical protein